MNDNSRKNLEDTMNDCLDKAYACDADSEDYTKLIQKAVQIGEILNEEQKIESDKEIELKKIEQSSNVTMKDMFLIGTPILAEGVWLGVKMWFMRVQTKDICHFEETNTFTSSAGRWIAGTFRDLFSFNRRGH